MCWLVIVFIEEIKNVRIEGRVLAGEHVGDVAKFGVYGELREIASSIQLISKP